ncbi:hypothetical protein SCP_1500970 [Sparassis crispa]|uniref:Uncharacterized protein n=1 Tax=Sparassis crispa TaxID=139825 RepID=A0A401H3V0_9APHY|nr:hypothetical protein SCP_1500970 [Sparassis crispa]GBE89094.1 hypothetical protein SCP_1500970 [Sparassis crispa]
MELEGEPVLHYSFLDEAASLPSANGVGIPLQLYPNHCRWSPEGYDELITEIPIGIITPDIFAQAWYNVEHPNTIGTPTESYPPLALSTSSLQVDTAELDDLQLSGYPDYYQQDLPFQTLTQPSTTPSPHATSSCTGRRDPLPFI